MAPASPLSSSTGTLLVGLLVGSLVLLTSATTSQQTQAADLRLLCRNKHVDITQSSQIRAFASQLGEGPSGCPSRLVLALIDLDKLIHDPEETDVCSLEKVAKIKQYYDNYVAYSVPPATADGKTKVEVIETVLPKALRNFFLGYGLRVSHLCKKTMINSLQFESQRLLEPADYEQIGRWTDEQSSLGIILNEPTDYDDLLLPHDISRVLQDVRIEGPPTREDPSSKVFIQTQTGAIIRRTQAICQRRFKPLYEQLILPFVYLSNLGFNYQGEDLERESRELSVNKEVHQWYRIVYLCESLDGLEIVEDPNDSEKTENTDKMLVRVLTKEEAEALKAAANEHSAPSSAELDEEANQVPLVEFKAQFGNQLEDEILHLKDKNFMRLVNSFDIRKSELDRIRARMLKKLAKFLINCIKLGKFELVTSLWSRNKQLSRPTARTSNANDELVLMFDDYVAGVAAANSADSPVAGAMGRKLTGTAKRYYHQTAYNGASGIARKLKSATIDRAKAAKYFYYFVAVALFLGGVIALSVG